MSEQTNTQSVCPLCGGPGYHVRGCLKQRSDYAEKVIQEAINEELELIREAHGAAVIAQSEAVQRMEVAEEQFRKASEWNRLTELELNSLRSIVEAQDQSIHALQIMLRELCEKMEAGVSGPRETKRARALLNHG